MDLSHPQVPSMLRANCASVCQNLYTQIGSRMASKFSSRVLIHGLIVSYLLITIVCSTGCIGAMSQLLYVIKGHQVPAAFDGMEGKRVAVVCVSDASAYGPDTLTYTVNKAVSMKLATSVKDISVVNPNDIEQWVDAHGWDETNFVEIGKAVDADLVLAIEIGSYSIHEGATMYKGRSDITATVFDLVNGGQVAYVHGPHHFSFPENGRPAIQTSDRQFEAVYLAKLTQHISRQFHEHDHLETIAEDASLMR